MNKQFNQVIIVGVGLIGSSLGRDLIKRKLAHSVVGVGRNLDNLKTALRQNAINQMIKLSDVNNLKACITAETGLIILATPVGTIKSYLKALRGISERVIVMDVGSTKGSLVREAERWGINYVAAHPIAGTEKGGAAGGQLNLFQDKKCLLIPTGKQCQTSWKRVAQLWKDLGSTVIPMKAEAHDRILGAVSHLPHAAAYSLVLAISQIISVEDEARFALGGLRDTVRIAASPPEVWTDIFLENRRHVRRSLKAYIHFLSQLEQLIESKNRLGLAKFLKKAQSIRLKLS